MLTRMGLRSPFREPLAEKEIQRTLVGYKVNGDGCYLIQLVVLLRLMIDGFEHSEWRFGSLMMDVLRERWAYEA